MSYPKQHGSGTERGYNGWKNYATWNVALWICNDEGLYNEARKYARRSYTDFAKHMADNWQAELATGCAGISKQTPDGVSWNDPELDFEALDTMIREL